LILKQSGHSNGHVCEHLHCEGDVTSPQPLVYRVSCRLVPVTDGRVSD